MGQLATISGGGKPNVQPAKSAIAPAVSARMRRIGRSLLKWYSAHHRPLPWRTPAQPHGRPDPYHVLVSEIMLQQTQVTTVEGYFHRFLDLFPDPETLANADEQAVLKAWQGLGYYTRARRLHAAAGQIVDRHRGRVPSAVDDLMALPGVGRSTAGAIASIAFGRQAPILDGNVARVLARLQNIDDPTDRPATQRHLWRLSEQVSRGIDPGNTNQALMELGAVVCLPRNPQCPLCPVRRSCYARRDGTTQQIPIRLPKRPPQPVEHHVLAIRRGNRYLVQRRPTRGLWSRMWHMPTAEAIDTHPPITLEQWVNQSLGLQIGAPRRIGRFVHMTTHRKIYFTVWTATPTAGRLRPGMGIWRNLLELDDLPLPNPYRKAIELVVGARAL